MATEHQFYCNSAKEKGSRKCSMDILPHVPQPFYFTITISTVLIVNEKFFKLQSGIYIGMV